MTNDMTQKDIEVEKQNKLVRGAQIKAAEAHNAAAEEHKMEAARQMDNNNS